MSKLSIVKPYGQKIRVQIDWPEDAQGAKQEFKDECDINIILKRFEKQGILTHVNNKIPYFGEAPSQTYTEVMHQMAAAKEYFETLPSSIRNEFGNSVSEFIDFATNPENGDALEALGFDTENSGIKEPEQEVKETAKADSEPETGT